MHIKTYLSALFPDASKCLAIVQKRQSRYIYSLAGRDSFSKMIWCATEAFYKNKITNSDFEHLFRIIRLIYSSYRRCCLKKNNNGFYLSVDVKQKIEYLIIKKKHFDCVHIYMICHLKLRSKFGT